MIKKANINWTAKQLTKMMAKGTIVFDNAVQRTLCWKDDKKSLLIHSMIVGFPIPPFYSAKEGSLYSMLDGKQRSNAIADYIGDEYELTDIPEVTLENGEVVDINGKRFSELPEEIQDDIRDYSLSIYYFDGISDDEISEMFFRLNNGKALSAIELTRVKAKSFDMIVDIGKHQLFTSALTEKALSKYTNEDIVIKSWALLNMENPSFETKYIRPLMRDVEITDKQARDIKLVYDYILATHNYIASEETDDNKEKKLNKKVAKRVITRTHLLSLVPVAFDSTKKQRSVQDFVGFVKSFFCGKRSASISDIYNTAAGSGSARREKVKKRINAIEEAYNAYFKEDISKGDDPDEEKSDEVEAKNNNQEEIKVESEMEEQEEQEPTERQMKLMQDAINEIDGLDDEDSDSMYIDNNDNIPDNILNAYSGTVGDCEL